MLTLLRAFLAVSRFKRSRMSAGWPATYSAVNRSPLDCGRRQAHIRPSRVGRHTDCMMTKW